METNMSDINWSDEHFVVNKQFWLHHGHSVALPFRLLNLTLVGQLADTCELQVSIYGRTLLSYHVHKKLLTDHDDDFLIYGTLSSTKTNEFLNTLKKNGFVKIRETCDMVSFFRYGRYFDLHFTEIPFKVEKVSVHGYSVPLSADSTKLIKDKYPNRPDTYFQNNCFRQKVLMYANKVTEILAKRTLTKKHLKKGLSLAIILTRSLPKLATKALTKKKSLVTLKENEFLALKIDDDDALNWKWRGKHMSDLFRSGETFGECLERFRNHSTIEQFQVNECDTAEPFEEPLHLSYRFWNEGNNFFIYPLIYGFRHGVLPYSAANLYIAWKIKPDLYSREYFESLPNMTEQEIIELLKSNPIEVQNGCVTSGRHRATAMLGRLLRGEKYLPFYVQK